MKKFNFLLNFPRYLLKDLILDYLWGQDYVNLLSTHSIFSKEILLPEDTENKKIKHTCKEIHLQISKDNTRKLCIKKFFPNNMKENFASVIIGMRRSGKTTLIMQFCQIFKNKNKHADAEIYIPNTIMKSDYDSEYQTTLLSDLETLKENLATDKKRLFVFEDSVFTSIRGFVYRTIWKNPILRNFVSHRHEHNISCIFTWQYFESNQFILDYVDYVFLKGAQNQHDLNSLFNTFNYVFKFNALEQKHFEQILQILTENYGTLVIDLTQYRKIQNTKLEEIIFWY